MKTADETSVEQSVRELLDAERPCEQTMSGLPIGCTNQATWWRIALCCGDVAAKCDSHKYGVIRGTGMPLPADWPNLTCGHCQARYVDCRFEPIR